MGSLTFGGEDLGQHHAQAVGACVTRGHQTQQQQAGAGAQETQLLLRAAQARVQGEGPGRLLVPEREDTRAGALVRRGAGLRPSETYLHKREGVKR